MAKPTPAPETSPAAPSARRMIPLVLLLAGLLVGGVSGALVAGPLLSKGIAAGSADRPSPPDSALAEADDDGYDAAGFDPRTPRDYYLVEDLVLNPAESGGTRFLVASVAFQVGSAEIAAQMSRRDVEVRDAVLAVLASKTVPELLVPDSARSALKDELRRSVGRMFPRGAIRQVFLPKFVIQ